MLSGIRVLDVGGWGIGPIACQILGYVGADVIRIEPPHLDGVFHVNPKQRGVGTPYIGCHMNKRNIIVDLKTNEGRALLFRMVEKADVFIENHPPLTMEKLGCGYETIRAINPRMIYCASSGYGPTGPLAHSRSADHFMQAASGFCSITGSPGSKGEILRFNGYIDWATSLTICQGVLLALLSRDVTGEGQKVDTSQFESSLVIQRTRIAEYFTTGISPKPMGSANPNIVPSQSFKTIDRKYINVSVPRQEYWPKLCQALGLEALEQDPRFRSNEERVKNREQLIPILEKKFSQEPARMWLLRLRKHDVPCGPINTVDEIYVDPHLLENQLLVVQETPWGEAMFTNFPVKFSRPPRPLRLQPPVKPDTNREEILAEIQRQGEAPPAIVRRETKKEEKRLPLQGIKVVDLTEEIAGPHCSMQLGDGGAEVIKVEPLNGDLTRSVGVKIKGESALFLSLNRNKKSISVDVREPRGREIVHELTKEADVFLESFRPGQAERLGLGYEDIRRINPNIIYCSISAFGSVGPYKEREASELELQGMSGFQWYLGEPGEAPVRAGADIAAMEASLYAFVGILTALYYRKKTGIGQKVETSIFGALMATAIGIVLSHFNPDSFEGYFLTGPFDHVETGYRTKDKQIIFGMPVIPGKREEAWISFCKQLGLSRILEDPILREKGALMFGMGLGRDAQALKPLIQPAFENRTAEELREIIEGIGGQVAIFKTYEEIFSEPQVEAVGMVQEVEHPVAGKTKVVGIPWKFSHTPAKMKGPAPTLGQHRDEILLQLGYSAEQIAALRRANVIA